MNFHRLRKAGSRSATFRYLVWGLEVLLLGSFWQMSAWLSPDRASAMGRWLLQHIGPRLAKTRHIQRNLRLAFPAKTDAEIHALTRAVWGNLGAVLAEYPHLQTLCSGVPSERIQVVVRGDIKAFGHTKKPAVFVTAHLANWEIAGYVAAQLGPPLTGLYTPLQNPWLDRMLYRYRLVLGCGMVNRDRAARVMLRSLEAGRSIGLIVDQRVDSGKPLAFFGHDKLTTLVPASLALRFGCELLPIRVERLEGAARFRVTVYEPVEPDDEALSEEAKLVQMMSKINGLFEAWIRERPQDWQCGNRRWPKTIPMLSSSA